MKHEIATLHERMSQGGDWRAFRDEIAALHAQDNTEAEYVELLRAHHLLMQMIDDVYDPETAAKLHPIAEAEYLTFLNKEAMWGENINPVALERITGREIEAGRLDPDSNLRKLATAGAAVLGDSDEITAHRCRQGDYFAYGACAAAVGAFGALYVPFSPLWLIIPAFVVGWWLNERERTRIKAEIAERHAA